MQLRNLISTGLACLIGLFCLGLYFSSLKRYKTHFKPIEFVTISLPEADIKVAKFETSVAEWSACVNDGACTEIEIDPSLEDYPMTGVNLEDINKYLKWYSKRSGQAVGLPSKEEWSFVAGTHISTSKKKLFEDPRMAWAANYDITKSNSDTPFLPRGSYGANEHGVYDIKGGVWEWSETCVPNIFKQSTSYKICAAGRAAMGEHIAILSDQLREPGKAGCSAGQPPTFVGFRIIKRQPI